jgi:hypothetical protein
MAAYGVAQRDRPAFSANPGASTSLSPCPQKEDFARADRHSFGGLGPPLARLPAQVEAELLELRELSLRHREHRVNSRHDAPAANPFSKRQGARRSAA